MDGVIYALLQVVRYKAGSFLVGLHHPLGFLHQILAAAYVERKSSLVRAYLDGLPFLVFRAPWPEVVVQAFCRDRGVNNIADVEEPRPSALPEIDHFVIHFQPKSGIAVAMQVKFWKIIVNTMPFHFL